MKFRAFWQSKSGNFAILTALTITSLILAAGMGIDYSRVLRAKTVLQDQADAASLALAESDTQGDDAMKTQAQHVIAANASPQLVDDVTVRNVVYTKDHYDVALQGAVPTTFMSIAGIRRIPISVSSDSIRDTGGSVEVALVLDNTNSMSELDDQGVSKIEALRSAASKLVTNLHSHASSNVRISVVPYADYVNVGVTHRYDGWVSVGADYSSTSTPPAGCGTPVTTTQSYCTVPGPTVTKTCTSVSDGVVKSYQCTSTGPCQQTATRTVTSTPSCNVHTTNYQWFGCVGSRNTGTLRLSDESSDVPYPGYLDTIQRCPAAQILPLTADEKPVQDTILQMQAGSSAYVTNTYIPAGLIWGLNTLSPEAPFTEAAPFSPDNKKPRKVIVLMTDGANTMYYTASDGRHQNIQYTTSDSQVTFNPGQTEQTKDDSLAICRNIKDQGIEIFSIAFAVDSDASKALLQSCATDNQHYFNAQDSLGLSAAFTDIASALTQIRLTR